MSKEEAVKTLLMIFEAKEPEVHITNLLRIAPDLESPTVLQVVESLKHVLFSKSHSNFQKFQCVRTLNSLMQLQVSCIVSVIHKKIAGSMADFIFFQENIGGFDLWLCALQPKDTYLFKTLILALQSVEIWADQFSTDFKGKETIFFKTFQLIKSKKVEFPPSFFLQHPAKIPKVCIKKDLHRTRKLAKECLKGIKSSNKQRTLPLKKILNSYEKSLFFEVETRKNSGKNVNDSVYIALKEIQEVNELFAYWKSTDFLYLPIEEIVKNQGRLIEDPVPKFEPIEEIHRDFEANSSFYEFQDLGKPDQKATSEILKIKGKLLDAQELVDMYKADLNKVQANYVKILEINENLLTKNKSLVNYIQDLESALDSNKNIIEDLVNSKNHALKEIEAYSYQNEVCKISIKELQDSYEIMERQNSKQKSYIENIENANILLLSSNQTLKFELEKSKATEESLMFSIKTQNNRASVTRKNSFECQPQFEQAFEAEFEKNLSSDDEDKQIPNVSNRFILKSYLTENVRSMNLMRDMDLSKPDVKILKKNKNLNFCDNFKWILQFYKSNEGVIYEDYDLQIGLKMVVEEKECWGAGYVLNKTRESLRIDMNLLSFPESLKDFQITTGNFEILVGEFQAFSVFAKCRRPFSQLPIVKIEWNMGRKSAILKFPISYLLFFTMPLEDPGKQKFKACKEALKPKTTRSKRRVLFETLRIFRNFSTKELEDNNGIIMHSLSPIGPVTVKVQVLSDKLKVQVQSINSEVSNLTLNLISEQLDNI